MGFHISFPIPTKLMYDQQAGDMQSNECGLAHEAARISFLGGAQSCFLSSLFAATSRLDFQCPGQKQV